MAEYKVSKFEIYKNPYIGLYISTSDKIAIAPPTLPEKLLPVIKETLQVDTLHLTFLASSTLTGVYSVLNTKGIIVPAFAEDGEIHRLKKELGLNVVKISDPFCAVKNNITVNDKFALCNDYIKKHDLQMIKDALDVEVISLKVGKVHTVGSHNVLTNAGLLAFNEATDQEMEVLRKFTGTAVKTTVNLGVTAIAAGIVANSKGALVGGSSSGFELGNIYQGLSNQQSESTQ